MAPVYYEPAIAAIFQICANDTLESVNPPPPFVPPVSRIPWLVLVPVPTAIGTPVPVYSGAANAYPGMGLAPAVFGLILVPVAP